MTVILALILATAVGLALQFLISGRISALATPLDYARKWSGWLLFATSIGVLIGFFIKLDAESCPRMAG